MEERILTKHPAKKHGVSISKYKYELIRKAIIQSLRAKGELTFTDLAKAVKGKLKGGFEGSIPWYVESVKLDLEARKVIERVPRTKPQLYRLIVK
ncbi:MAG: DUF6958 family protein [Nitrososphaerales archaeon]